MFSLLSFLDHDERINNQNKNETESEIEIYGQLNCYGTVNKNVLL
jgi:hypothetical protein